MRNKDVRRRLSGFGLPILGGSIEWETIEESRGVARRVFTFLEDRRVLFNPYHLEAVDHCIESVIEIRRMLTGEMARLVEGDPLIPHLRAMQSACRRFLDLRATDGEATAGHFWLGGRDSMLVIVGLGDLRSAMGIQIGLIAAAFNMDVPDTLADILPPPADDDDPPRSRPRSGWRRRLRRSTPEP